MLVTDELHLRFQMNAPNLEKGDRMQVEQQQLEGRLIFRDKLQVIWENPSVPEWERQEAQRLLDAGKLSIEKGKLVYNGRIVRQTLTFTGETLVLLVENVFDQVSQPVQPGTPLSFFKQFVNVGATNQATSFSLCGVALEMGLNKYVKLQKKPQDTGIVQAPSYGALRSMVEAEIDKLPSDQQQLAQQQLANQQQFATFLGIASLQVGNLQGANQQRLNTLLRLANIPPIDLQPANQQPVNPQQLAQLSAQLMQLADPFAQQQKLTNQVRNALKWPQQLAADASRPCSELAGLLAGVLGVAEPSRNPLAFPTLLMFLDLAQYNVMTWASGLGPDAMNRNSLSTDRKAIYFGMGLPECDAEVAEITNEEVAKRSDGAVKIDVTDRPALQWLKRFVARYYLLEADVRTRVLGEGNVESISALGGALPMVGAESAASADPSKDSPLRALVRKKACTITILWFGQAFDGLRRQSANNALALKVWGALGDDAQRDKAMKWLLRQFLFSPYDQTVSQREFV